MRSRARTSPSSEEAFARQLAEARAGCPQALGELLQGCHRFLLMVANEALESTLRPKRGASDLVQDTFVIAAGDFASFRGTTHRELVGWLHAILSRRLQTHTRSFCGTQKRKVARELPIDADAVEFQAPRDRVATPAEAAEQADEVARVRLALAQLPAVYQEILELRIWQRMPFAEIGLRMGRSTAAAEKLWFRAVRRLQQELRNAP